MKSVCWPCRQTGEKLAIIPLTFRYTKTNHYKKPYRRWQVFQNNGRLTQSRYRIWTVLWKYQSITGFCCHILQRWYGAFEEFAVCQWAETNQTRANTGKLYAHWMPLLSSHNPLIYHWGEHRPPHRLVYSDKRSLHWICQYRYAWQTNNSRCHQWPLMIHGGCSILPVWIYV